MTVARLLDLVIVGFLLALGIWLLPGWPTENDHLLFGPDAGEWAIAARAIFDGRFGDVDPHRLPLFPSLVAGAMAVSRDVAIAGHGVNHVLHLLTPLVVYALVRIGGGHGAGMLAGVWVIVNPALMLASRRFAVDPTVAFFVPLTLLTAWAGGRYLPFAFFAGMVAGVTAASHLTALAFPLPGLLMCLLNGEPGFRRWLGAVLYAAGAALAVGGVLQLFPHESLTLLTDTVAEGIVAPNAGGNTPDPRVLGAGQEQARAMLEANAKAGAQEAWSWVSSRWRPEWLPWNWALALPWLGLVGPFLMEPTAAGWRGWFTRSFGGLAIGLPVTLALAPLVAFAAADSPERYSENLLPVAAVLVARGLVVVPVTLDRLVAWLWSRWSVGLTGLVLFGGYALVAASGPHPLLQDKPQRPEDREARAVGMILAARYPAGIGAVCPVREALGYAGMSFCPTTPCPFMQSEGSYLACVEIMRKECPGTEAIPYLVLANPTPDLVSPGRRAMDAWVAENREPMTYIAGTSATLYEIPRTGAVRSPNLPPPEHDASQEHE